MPKTMAPCQSSLDTCVKVFIGVRGKDAEASCCELNMISTSITKKEPDVGLNFSHELGFIRRSKLTLVKI